MHARDEKMAIMTMFCGNSLSKASASRALANRVASGENIEGLPLYETSGEHCFEAQGVTQTFLTKDGREVWALDSFSMKTSGAEIVGIIGPSGCGKSTFLRLACGLDEPLEGRIFFDGQRVNGPDPQRCMVFQNANLFEWLTVEDNIAFPLRIVNKYNQFKYKIPRLIHMMGLDGFEKSYPTQISGGMASRCALARAFVQDPDLICFDEPLSALDAFTRATLQDEILAMQAVARKLMIIVTHDIEEAVYLCDRVIVMSARPGRLKAELEIGLPHPRNRISPEFVEKRRLLLELLED